jgi:hypothetical protein
MRCSLLCIVAACNAAGFALFSFPRKEENTTQAQSDASHSFSSSESKFAFV